VAAETQEMIAGDSGGLFVRSWLPLEAPRAVLVICPGFNSHSGYYGWVGAQSAAAGFAAYAVDLRGRGQSEGERFYAATFDDYVADLQASASLARGRHPGLPLFVLGHSAGGVTACLYALDHGGELAGLICEDFAFELPAPDVALAILKGLSHLAPHAHALTLKNEDFSRNPQVRAAMNSDPLIAGESQPFATVAALVGADERLRRDFPLIMTPLLIIHGKADKAAKPSGSALFFDHSGAADKTLKLYDDRLHDPLNDIGREEVMADVLLWIEHRIVAPDRTLR
jgi:acylglycerol lipase